MENTKIQETIGMIRQALPYLFDDYGFKVVYFTPDYGFHWYGTAIGLASTKCKCHLICVREIGHSVIRMDIASKTEAFDKYETTSLKWQYLPQIIYFLSGKQEVGNADPIESLTQDSEDLKPCMDEIIKLYEKPGYINEWLEVQRQLEKDKPATIEQIKAERVRLHSLGLDSSLKAAMENLRGKNG